MAFGLKIYNQDGTTKFTSECVGWQFYACYYLPPGASGSIDLRSLGSVTVWGVSIPTRYSVGHVVMNYNNIIYYTGVVTPYYKNTGGWPISPDSYVYVFIRSS